MKIHYLIFLTIFTFTFANAKTQTDSDQELAAMAKELNLNQQELDFLIEEHLNETQNNQSQELMGGPTWVTVGSDVSCDYRTGNTRIQQAIDNGNTEIRIAHGTYQENILIDDKNVKLLGGYADCQAADNNVYNASSTSTIIKPAANSGKPVISVTGNSTRNDVMLRNLTIDNGQDNPTYVGGGISFYLADTSASMRNMAIRNNTGKWGGGVAVQFGNTDINMNGVIISGNNASVGGGIYCNGSDNSVVFNNSSNVAGILANTATSDGGGVYVAAGCRFTNYVGGILEGIILNKAGRNGGGIFASNGAVVNLQGHRSCFIIGGFPFCFGNSEDPVNIIQNKADNDNDNDGDGGAVYATGSTTNVTATNVYFNGNTGYNGGDVSVMDNANFTTYSFNPKSCWEKGRCNQYKGNRASSVNGYGGAFYAEDGGTLLVKTAHIEGNRADFGSGFYLIGAGSKLDLEGSYIVNNGGGTNYLNNYPVRITGGAEARLDYTTIADNQANGASVANSSSTLRIYNSLIHDLSGAPALFEATPVISVERCIIVTDMGDVSSGSYNIVDDPQFVDRNNNDYHINAAISPAVDYCDENHSQAQHTTTDSDGEARGWDDYLATDNYQGSYF